MLGLDRQRGSRKSSAGGCPRCHPPARGLPPGRALPSAGCRLPLNGRRVCGGWDHRVYCLEMKVHVVSKQCGSEGCPAPAAEDPRVCARVDRLVLLQARPRGAWFLASGPAGSVIGPSGPPPLASHFLCTCCRGAARFSRAALCPQGRALHRIGAAMRPPRLGRPGGKDTWVCQRSGAGETPQAVPGPPEERRTWLSLSWGSSSSGSR